MTPWLLGLMLATSVSPGWETHDDPALGVALLKPVGWSVEALANGAIEVSAPPPLQGRTLLVPMAAPNVSPQALVVALAELSGSRIVAQLPLQDGHAARVQAVDENAVGRAALIEVVKSGDRALAAIVSAPESELDVARPALAAIAEHARFSRPELVAPPEPLRPLLFEPFRESKERAFSGELPGDWEKDTAVEIVKGSAPYVRASIIGRAPDNLYAFVHYKLASFQVPIPELTPQHPGYRHYEPGALVLERFLFPSVAARDPQAIGEWRIERKGRLESLFSHPSGVRFDGQEVVYGYRYRGEAMRGRAYVVTYHLPQQPSPIWFLYGLYGWESPVGREANARAAGLRLLQSFQFEDRYAAQADMFWKLAHEAALKALTAEPPARQTVETPRRPDAELSNPFDRAARSLSSAMAADGQEAQVTVGIEAMVSARGEQMPRIDFKAIETLR